MARKIKMISSVKQLFKHLANSRIFSFCFVPFSEAMHQLDIINTSRFRQCESDVTPNWQFALRYVDILFPV